VGFVPAHELAVVPDHSVKPVIGLRCHDCSPLPTPRLCPRPPRLVRWRSFRAYSSTLRRKATPGKTGHARRRAGFPDGPFRNGPSVRSFRPQRCFCNEQSKYVNMADINLKTAAGTETVDRSASTTAPAEPVWDIIELLFFAYRDFVGDP